MICRDQACWTKLSVTLGGQSAPHIPELGRGAAAYGHDEPDGFWKALPRLRWRARTSNILTSHYPPSGGARAALVVGTDPTFATVVDERVAWLAHVAAYEPGSFFRRELPATRDVLERRAGSGSADRGGVCRSGPGREAGSGCPCVRRDWHSGDWGGQGLSRRYACCGRAPRRRHPTVYITAAGIGLEHAASLVAAMAGQTGSPTPYDASTTCPEGVTTQRGPINSIRLCRFDSGYLPSPRHAARSLKARMGARRDVTGQRFDATTWACSWTPGHAVNELSAERRPGFISIVRAGPVLQVFGQQPVRVPETDTGPRR